MPLPSASPPALAALAGVLVLAGCKEAGPAGAPSSPSLPSGPVVADNETVLAAYAGSESCKECHEEEQAKWRRSHHHYAERAYDPAMDDPAFEPPRTITHVTQESRAELVDKVAEIITRGFGNKIGRYRVQRVIGHDPLRQFLVAGPRGELQTMELCWDPHRSEWFDVYGDEDRQPGEWGHWSGRGMNWDSMCASCHNTRLRKNYDAGSDRYRVTMAERSVGCEACHGPLQPHVDWQLANKDKGKDKGTDPTLPKFDREQYFQTCAPCHARRGELTGDLVPGESFHDHFRLTVPDESDIYYADGQVREEDYVFASLLGSTMHAAGVRCVDCHDPHSGERILEGDALCMRCHAGVPVPIPPLTKVAPAIDPLAHGHHKPGSVGNECTGCHMPETVYMARDPRRDHGFTIPDPLLTKKFGIPNACNRCHKDKDVDWALEWSEKWYGDKLDRHTRRRAITVAEARQGLFVARDKLITLLRGDDPPAWMASASLLLGRWVFEAPAAEALREQLDHDSPLVRAAAVESLGAGVQGGLDHLRAALEPLLEDPSRNVRVAAAWALRDTVDPGSLAGRELEHSMAISADQPAGQMRLGQFRFARGDRDEAVAHMRRAIEWDPNSPPFHHDLALMLNIAGDNRGAMAALREAIRLAPREGEYHYKLALAQHEGGDLPAALQSLRTAVEVDPGHGRAWYNLGLAYNTLGQVETALEALVRGEQATPNDPAIPYARATILVRLGHLDAAVLAARRALEIDPNHAPARQLLQSMAP